MKSTGDQPKKRGNSMKKVISLTLAIGIILGIFAGCGGEQGNPPSTEPSPQGSGQEEVSENPGEELVIGYSCGWAWVPYCIAGRLGAEVAAREEGIELISTSANNDMQTQIADVENLVQRGIDGLLMYAIDSAGLSPIASEVNQSIPVGTVDIGVSETQVDFHVASDNYEIGCMAARFVGDYLEGQGNIAIVGWSTVDATVDREAGFKDTLAEEYPGITIATHYGDGGSDRTAALNATESILQAHPDLDMIWGSNQQAALGALAAVDAANVDIPIFGVDSDVESLTAILENPRFIGTISQDPYQMGYSAVKTMAAILRGESVDENIYTEVHVVTKENAEEFLEREQEYQDIYNSGTYE